jgi:hypothetical protein
MNELATFVPGDISFQLADAILGASSNPPYMEITFVLFPLFAIAFGVFYSNKSVWKNYRRSNIFLQCTARVFLDIALVIGICGSAIGVAAMTMTFNISSDMATDVGIALTTLCWGGIFVGLGYFLKNPALPIEARISGRAALLSLVAFFSAVWYVMNGTKLNFFETYFPLSDALIPYLLILSLCLLGHRFNGKPWIISFTDANLLATMGGLAIGILLWFKSGLGYEEGRAAIYTCAITLMWGSIFYVIAYVASLYFGTQEQGNYQTKTWHLSEGAVFFIFLLYAPVGATEWKRESQDQAVQEANNQAQELRIEQLEAELVELRALIKTKETS